MRCSLSTIDQPQGLWSYEPPQQKPPVRRSAWTVAAEEAMIAALCLTHCAANFRPGPFIFSFSRRMSGSL